jgi:hypothetical protein
VDIVTCHIIADRGRGRLTLPIFTFRQTGGTGYVVAAFSPESKRSYAPAEGVTERPLEEDL